MYGGDKTSLIISFARNLPRLLVAMVFLLSFRVRSLELVIE